MFSHEIPRNPCKKIISQSPQSPVFSSNRNRRLPRRSVFPRGNS